MLTLLTLCRLGTLIKIDNLYNNGKKSVCLSVRNKYDVMTYDIMTHDVMTYDVVTYDVMADDVMTNNDK